MNVLTAIRPRVEHLSDAHAELLLQAIVSSPAAGAPVRRRLRSRLIGLGLVVTVTAGGAAYAGGLVPHMVTERFDQLHYDGWPEPIHHERLIATVPLSNGATARVWAADTQDGFCEIRDMSGATRPEDLPVGCARWIPHQRSSLQQGIYWQTAPTGPALVYGEFHDTPADVATVEVIGNTWTRALSVTRDHTFAGEVPAGNDGQHIRLRYLDANAHPLGSKTLEVTIESE